MPCDFALEVFVILQQMQEERHEMAVAHSFSLRNAKVSLSMSCVKCRPDGVASSEPIAPFPSPGPSVMIRLKSADF